MLNLKKMRLTISEPGNSEMHLCVLDNLCAWTSREGIFIDLMCCEGSQTSRLDFKRKIFVDVQERPIVNMKDVDFFIKGDVFHFNSVMAHTGWTADVMVCLDGIEHLSKEGGF